MEDFLPIAGFLILALSPLWLLIGGGVTGRVLEKRHFASIALREQANADVVVTDLRTLPEGISAARSELVTGSMVVAADYFKSFASSLRNLVGGEMLSLQRMQERARREAILRMTEKAKNLGARTVINVRIETSTIAGKRHGQCAGVEVLAYGTAVLP